MLQYSYKLRGEYERKEKNEKNIYTFCVVRVNALHIDAGG